MKWTGIVLGGALVFAAAGTALAQQQNNVGTQPPANAPAQNPVVYGSPGLEEGGGYRQVAPNDQRGYSEGGRITPGSYNPRGSQNGLTPVNHMPNKNPFGTGARGGGRMPSQTIPTAHDIHHN
jgi:hypothetical protein